MNIKLVSRDKVYPKIFGTFSLFFITTQIFDGILFQIQSSLANNYILTPTLLKFVALIIALFSLSLDNKKLTLFLSIIFLISIIIYNFLINGNLTKGASVYYSTLIICSVLMFSKKKYIDRLENLKGSIVLIFILAIIFAVLQAIGINLLKISLNGEVFIQSHKIYGSDRVFSLFSSGLNLGYTLVVATILIQISSNRTLRIFSTIFFGVLVYFTYTRVIYVMYILAIISMLSISFWKNFNQRYRVFLQLSSYLFMSYLIAYFASLLPTSRDLSSSESVGMRLNQWSDILGYVDRLPMNEFLFGTGLTQGDDFLSQSLLVDNMYIAVFLNIGLVGLIIWLALLASYIWNLNNFVAVRNRVLFEIIVYLWTFAMVYNLSVGIFEVLILSSALIFLARSESEKNSNSNGDIQWN